jgi:hypothetical protein
MIHLLDGKSELFEHVELREDGGAKEEQGLVIEDLDLEENKGNGSDKEESVETNSDKGVESNEEKGAEPVEEKEPIMSRYCIFT